MQKIILPVSKCIPGMITAQPIVNLQTGTVIVGQNQILTESTLDMIQNFIHTDIWIYLDSFNKVWNLPSEIIENYRKYSNALKTVLGNTKDGTSVHMEELEDICDNLASEFNQNHILVGCTNLMKNLEKDLYAHSMNVTFISILIAKWMKLDTELFPNLIKAALLHDIGCINLPFNPMKHEEFDADMQTEYEKHPIYSYNIVSKIKDIDSSVAKAILAHHEKYDGSGFPLKVTAPYISSLAKIIALADEYELLRNKHHIFDTLKILQTEMIAKFDTQMLLTFCQTIANYYVGVYVTLSTGDIGEVVFINTTSLYRPLVKVKNKYIDLMDWPSIQIDSVD